MFNLPKVAVISLGGTISAAQRKDKGVDISLSATNLVEMLPELKNLARIFPINLYNLPSIALGFDNLIEIADKIINLFQEGYDGIVITQGTDTIEETAFFFDITIPQDNPVVITGAMKNPTLLGSDSLSNLYNAILVALNDKSKGLGTLVVMNDQIHLARFVQKTHTYSIDAVRSPLIGPVGWISEGYVNIVLKPNYDRFILSIEKLKKATKKPRIGFFTAVIDLDSELIRTSLAPYDGIIVEAAGGGHVSPPISDILIGLSREIPVVLSSRTRCGKILRRTYSFKGGEIDLLSRGLISGGYLNSLKARVLLYCLVKAGYSLSEIRDVFEKYFN